MSYARLDDIDGRVTRLVTRIRDDLDGNTDARELKVFFDKTEIHGMDDWRHRILGALRESRLLLIFLSPSLLDSDNCAWELNEYLKREIALGLLGDGVAAIYFVEIPGWTGKVRPGQVKGWIEEVRRRHQFDLRLWSEEVTPESRDEGGNDELQALGIQIRNRLRRVDSFLGARGNVDRHNDRFVGRVAELRRLHEMVGLGKIGVLTAVHGLGGIGKTALAIEYAHAFAHEYPGGIWQTRCEGREDLRAVFTSLIGSRDLDFALSEEERKDTDRAFQRVLNELKQRAEAATPPRVLIILDNVDRGLLLSPAQTCALPTAGWLNILVTTRMGEREMYPGEKDRTFLPVDELREDDALDLIEAYQPGGQFPFESERDAAREIVRSLGGFTLAIEIAAVLLGRLAGEVTCAAYLARLRRDLAGGNEILEVDESLGVRHREVSLRATLQPTLDRLSPSERLALSYAASLPADQIVIQWLRALVASRHPEMGQDAPPGFPDPWHKLVNSLLSLRLLQATGNRDGEGQLRIVRMHRLLQVILAPREAPERAALLRAVLDQAQAECASLRLGPLPADQRWEIEPLLGLAILCLQHYGMEPRWLTTWLTHALLEQGRLRECETLLRDAISVSEAQHRQPGVLRTKLGLVLTGMDRFDEAEGELLLALTEAERAGSSERATAVALAEVLLRYGTLQVVTYRLQEAEEKLLRALDLARTAVGDDHWIFTAALQGLGTILSLTGRDGAIPLLERALQDLWERGGPASPDTIGILLLLAQTFERKGQLLKAEKLLRDALLVGESGLPTNSPHLARIMVTLGQLLGMREEARSEAESLIRKAIAVDEVAFPDGSRAIAVDFQALGVLLMKDPTRLDEAGVALERSRRILEARSDPDDTNLMVTLMQSAALCRKRGNPHAGVSPAEEAMRILYSFQSRTRRSYVDEAKVIGMYRGLLRDIGMSDNEVRLRLERLRSSKGK